MNKRLEEMIKNLPPEKMKQFIKLKADFKAQRNSPEAKASATWREIQRKVLAETGMRAEDIEEEIAMF